MHSFEQFILPPPFSAMISLGLLAGLDALGKVFLAQTGLMALDQKRILRYQAVVVGAALISSLLFPLMLFGYANLMLVRIVGCVLIIGGLISLALTLLSSSPVIDLKFYFKNVRAHRILASAILLGLFLIALSPVTSADALDYHIGAAIAMLNNAGMPHSPEWFHSRFASNGEVLNALGIALGGEQFGALLQWASLIAIVSLLRPNVKDASGEYVQTKASASELIVLAAVSTPVLLFLVNGPKPQLWPVAMTTLAFALFAHPSVLNISKLMLRKRFGLAILLCITAAMAKFNYLLGGGLVCCFAMFTMARRYDLRAALIIFGFMLIFVSLPYYGWKSLAYDSNLIEAVFNPLPGHLPGADSFLAAAQNRSDFSSTLPFPISIFFPTDAGGLTTVIGVGCLVFFFFLRSGFEQQVRAALWLILIITVLTMVAAPPSARMYLEPYYWSLFLCTLSVERSARKISTFVSGLVKLQAVAFLLACMFGVWAFFPGAITSPLREAIMERAANGYGLMRWADSVLPRDAVLLNGHRSMALSPRSAIDYTWTIYVDPSSPEAKLYLSRIKQAGVTHVLILGAATSLTPMFGCFGKVFAGPGPGRTATRNPFNQGLPFEAWLYEFQSERLPECATRVSGG